MRHRRAQLHQLQPQGLSSQAERGICCSITRSLDHQLTRSSTARVSHSERTIASEGWDVDPQLSLYRPRTLALLRRYLQLSSAVGRLPSLIARECFRAKVTSYRMSSFEDSVIFVLDMERSLARLHHTEQLVITRVVFQGHSHDSAARLFGCTRKTLTQNLCVSLDHLSEQMLTLGLLRSL